MKNQYGWVSEYRRKKFLDGQKLRKEKQFLEHYRDNSVLNIPKTIAVMLDLDGTSDYINDEKAKTFINQLEIIKRKFGAQKGTISISTHYSNSDRMQEVLDTISRNLSNNIEIGINFYYGGTYDYEKKENTYQGQNFNSSKLETFCEYYVNIFSNNQWFAIIDDGISEDAYKKYQNRHPMLVCRPSKSEYELSKNNFMNISTTTKGFDGVIEVLNVYIESLRSLSPTQVLETQRNMITHLSSYDLTAKVRDRDYAFLERYFKEGYADDSDYSDALNYVIYTNKDNIPTKEELIHLKSIFGLMTEYFQSKSDEQNIEKVITLKKKFMISEK